MQQKIIQQIESLNKTLVWIKQHASENYEQQFMQVVMRKRAMRDMLNALEVNCGIAIVGECYSGKTHLLSSLFDMKEPHSFTITANGKEYNYLNDINSISSNSIHTAVVTRFTTYRNVPQLYSIDYPIVAKLLSVADIVMILCEAYYNGLADWPSDGQNLDDKASDICRHLKDQPLNEHPIVTAEDLCTIILYLKTYVPSAASINQSSFLKRIALVADRISTQEELADVFSALWNSHPTFDRLFTKLVDILFRLNFASDVYLPIDAVLHDGRSSILNWDFKMELSPESEEDFTNVYVINKYNNNICWVGTIAKGDISAVCKEVVFKVDEKYVESPRFYFMEDIAPEVQSMLSKNPCKADFLDECDLLDFPDWRDCPIVNSRNLLENENRLLFIIQRVKSRYLFHKYTDEHLINALLVCISNSHCTISDMYRRIETWIEKNIGSTPQERKRMIDITGGIAPLFYVATQFNKDLDFNRLSTHGDEYYNYAMHHRFGIIALRECFHDRQVEWPKNWTGQGINFKNSYLLCSEQESRNGYLWKDKYKVMRTLFCSNEVVNMLFENPALAWDVAVSCNNDGSLRIVEKLSALSPYLKELRERLFNDLLSIM